MTKKARVIKTSTLLFSGLLLLSAVRLICKTSLIGKDWRENRSKVNVKLVCEITLLQGHKEGFRPAL